MAPEHGPAAEELATVQPDVGRTSRRLERVTTRLRERLSRAGVSGLTRAEVGEPVGDRLTRNLITELVESTTLTDADLELLGRMVAIGS